MTTGRSRWSNALHPTRCRLARDTVRNYCYQLAAAGVLRQTGTLRFSLVRNLGPAAPRIMSAKLVFDPNSKTVVGPSVAREVQP
ncbi:hypothetical protein [Mesorhizobium sp. 8]|uniref:hypothetical protein n=1 Tax=Mesorhizobium sp. 8 TaxID=2584466 RepID=UPI00112233F4|nr:hypothetical protein [Mesorhizobium sp. 8]QDB99678.1 hypothetical protein FGU64_04245 [Mesorhizobium sp. 8]